MSTSARNQTSRDTGQSHALIEELATALRSTMASRWPGSARTSPIYETILEHGDPADDHHRNTPTRENADLIVLGRRGLGGIRQLLTGSITSKVMQACDRQCLTVR